MASTVWSNSTSQAPSYATVEGRSDSIVRLVEDPAIPKTIEFDELSMPYNGVEQSSGSPVDHTEIVGVQYPIIRINDIVFSYLDIVRMTITSDSFLPTINLTVNYPDSELLSNMPKDGDIISTYMRSSTSALNFLRNDFVITSCDSRSTKKDKRNIVNISGKLFIPGLEAEYNVFSVIGTTKTVCKEIAKKFGIGFAYNDEEDSNDFQNWICTGSVQRFIGDMIRRSWKDPESFYKAWIDLYYDLCYVNVNKFLLSAGNEEVDITFQSMTDMYQAMADGTGENLEDAGIAPKLFSNMNAMRGTPFYIKKWSITNNTGVSFNTGYSKLSYSFIHNQGLYNYDKDSCFSLLSNVPAYDKEKTDSHMIMRGRATYDPSYASSDEMARVNYQMSEKYITREWGGVEYTIDDATDKNTDNNNSWTGNVHKNYNRAPMHNNINHIELEKMYITIITDGLCLQVMRGEKVPVIIEKEVSSDISVIKDEYVYTTQKYNRMYSGFYVVDSIEYSYAGSNNQDDGKSLYSTKLVLKRREWPTPEETISDNTQNKQAE